MQLRKTQFHGYARKERLYNIWVGMKQRCRDKNIPDYENYGKKGIKVCRKWENDYLEFRKWSLSNGYRNDLTIDRIDVNKNYSPENCRWVDFLTQNNNKSDNVFLEYEGEKMTIAQWSHRAVVKPGTFKTRINRGWSIKEALTIPTNHRRK